MSDIDEVAVVGVAGQNQISTTLDAAQRTFGGGNADGFIAKFSLLGIKRYASYLGGAQFDEADAVTCDAARNCWVAGRTTSSDFPTTAGAYDPVCGTCNGSSGDGYGVKYGATGAVVYSTYLGGLRPIGIAVDGTGSAYVIGVSAVHGGIWKLSPDGSALNWSTHPGIDFGGIALLGGQPVVVGGDNGSGKARVLKIDATGGQTLVDNQLNYFGIGLGAASVAVDADGYAYVAGLGEFLDTTPGSFQPNCAGPPTACQDAFLVKTRVIADLPTPSIVPPVGVSLGGTPVTITGSGFQPGASRDARSRSCERPVHLSLRHIQATTAANPADTRGPGRHESG